MNHLFIIKLKIIYNKVKNNIKLFNNGYKL